MVDAYGISKTFHVKTIMILLLHVLLEVAQVEFSFATCSSDGSIRLWDLALQSLSTDQHPPINEPLATSSCLVSGGTFERESIVSGVVTQGYRSMAVSSDGKHLAAECS